MENPQGLTINELTKLIGCVRCTTKRLMEKMQEQQVVKVYKMSKKILYKLNEERYLCQ